MYSPACAFAARQPSQRVRYGVFFIADKNLMIIRAKLYNLFDKTKYNSRKCVLLDVFCVFIVAMICREALNLAL